MLQLQEKIIKRMEALKQRNLELQNYNPEEFRNMLKIKTLEALSSEKLELIWTTIQKQETGNSDMDLDALFDFFKLKNKSGDKSQKLRTCLCTLQTVLLINFDIPVPPITFEVKDSNSCYSNENEIDESSAESILSGAIQTLNNKKFQGFLDIIIQYQEEYIVSVMVEKMISSFAGPLPSFLVQVIIAYLFIVLTIVLLNSRNDTVTELFSNTEQEIVNHYNKLQKNPHYQTLKYVVKESSKEIILIYLRRQITGHLGNVSTLVTKAVTSHKGMVTSSFTNTGINVATYLLSKISEYLKEREQKNEEKSINDENEYWKIVQMFLYCTDLGSKWKEVGKPEEDHNVIPDDRLVEQYTYKSSNDGKTVEFGKPIRDHDSKYETIFSLFIPHSFGQQWDANTTKYQTFNWIPSDIILSQGRYFQPVENKEKPIVPLEKDILEFLLHEISKDVGYAVYEKDSQKGDNYFRMKVDHRRDLNNPQLPNESVMKKNSSAPIRRRKPK